MSEGSEAALGTTVNGVGAPPTPFGVVKGDQVY